MDIWQEHPLLFHYTGSQGLKGILETGTVHATHYTFLNDSSEIRALRPRLVELAKAGVRRAYAELAKSPKKQARMNNEGGVDVLVEKDAAVIAKVLYDVTLERKLPFRHFEPYVTSFCGHKDPYEIENGLLSQWRGYGSDAGYALVFDTEKLARASTKETEQFFYSSAQLGTVVYEGDDEAFKREFAELIERIDHHAEQILSKPEEDLSPLWTPLISCLSRYKHQGFREEQEVRLVVSPMSQNFIDHMTTEDTEFLARHLGKKAKARFSRQNLASYVVLFSEQDAPLPITKIIVGPHMEKEIRRARLQRHLELLGLEVEVSVSRTPLLA